MSGEKCGFISWVLSVRSKGSLGYDPVPVPVPGFVSRSASRDSMTGREHNVIRLLFPPVGPVDADLVDESFVIEGTAIG